MRTYKSISGQSIYDICLQTYGSLDYLYRLMQDNGIEGLDAVIYSGQSFVWDDNLVLDQQLNASFSESGVNYATDVSSLGSVYYVVNQQGSIVPSTPSEPYTPPNPSKTYEMSIQATYTSNADGAVSFVLTDDDGNLYTGWDMLQIEKEIKPLKKAQYVWNKATSTVTLLDTTLDAGETAYCLLTKIITE